MADQLFKPGDKVRCIKAVDDVPAHHYGEKGKVYTVINCAFEHGAWWVNLRDLSSTVRAERFVLENIEHPWWIEELARHSGEGLMTNDTRRAAAVVLRLYREGKITDTDSDANCITTPDGDCHSVLPCPHWPDAAYLRHLAGQMNIGAPPTPQDIQRVKEIAARLADAEENASPLKRSGGFEHKMVIFQRASFGTESLADFHKRFFDGLNGEGAEGWQAFQVVLTGDHAEVWFRREARA